MTSLLPSVSALLTTLSAITTFAYFTRIHYRLYLWDLNGPLLWQQTYYPWSVAFQGCGTLFNL
ncbi:MAG: hypothetical protein R2727_03745 [Bacteroidales bacterium]